MGWGFGEGAVSPNHEVHRRDLRRLLYVDSSRPLCARTGVPKRFGERAQCDLKRAFLLGQGTGGLRQLLPFTKPSC